MISLFLALLMQTPLRSARTLLPAQNEAVHAYAQSLEDLKRRTSGVSLEQVFADAKHLNTVLANTGDAPTIEDISEKEFADLRQRLPGIVLQREEAIIAEPEPKFFVKLAFDFGDDVDREFFRLYAATIPDGMWPVYIEQQTDFSGCTSFGERHLVDSYGAWTEFRNAHPYRYRAAALRIIGDIEEQLTSTCACGDRESVLRELREFAKEFPKSTATPAVIERIRAIEAGSSPVRFDCVSG